MRGIWVALLVGILMVPAFGTWGHAFQGETRDREGHLLWRDQGGDRSDRDGLIFERRERRGDEIYVYDRYGNLLRIERIR